MIKDDLDFIHDVTCPRCGSQASYRMTSETSFVPDLCGHEEMNALIAQRTKMVEERWKHQRDTFQKHITAKR